jgi:hypothetical protein
LPTYSPAGRPLRYDFRAVDSDKYVWFVADDSVVSIQGNGSKCIVINGLYRDQLKV